MSRDNPFPPRPDTLHKRITAILQDWYTAAVVQDDDSHGYVDVYKVHSTRHEAVDRVLDAVREALLSDAAVEAGAFGIAFVGIEQLYPHQDETWRAADEGEKELFRREVRSGIIAALDAALTNGGDDER